MDDYSLYFSRGNAQHHGKGNGHGGEYKDHIVCKYFAKSNSLINSIYSLIWNPVTFADVSNHWAKDAVNDMGARMVVTGASGSTVM